MKLSYRKRNLALCSTALIFTLMLAGMPVQVLSAESADMTITAEVKASCTVGVPPTLDIGEIPITELTTISPGSVVKHRKTLTVITTCTGADDYKLTFTSPTVNFDCAIGTNAVNNNQGMGFCVYDKNDQKINLAGGNTYTGTTTDGNPTFKIFPMRNYALPTPGTYTAMLTITISPP